ncbi:uncharacterized protein LOC122958570 [Acropora millepora]|uniref:uncharacterized protein LOC122958570 n=1 Tax=Acropora millepora TaxID=45264 RepID=UPI001CF24520|nr:uncharacterized protein LOC122958570 [Acropora millepora]
MVDARHDSARAAYHTTVTAISMTNPGLNIKEVSHDTVVGIKNDLRSSGISNSFDTWHDSLAELERVQRRAISIISSGQDYHEILEAAGIPPIMAYIEDSCSNLFSNIIENDNHRLRELLPGSNHPKYNLRWGKSAKKAITKVAQGTLSTEGKIWFTELSDKVKCIKTHCYYAMKNCGGDAGKLRSQLRNIVEHYKGNHRECNQESRLLRYTYYIESFHNCLLIYVPKRIHFSDKVYNMQVHLACLDWNENVDRDVYTTKTYQSIKRPDRVAPFRVLKPKTFLFKENIWATFYAFNW